MNKLTLSAIIASTLFITACDQAQETTEGAMDKATEMTHSAAEHAENAAGHPVGTQSDIDALTAQYHEQMKAH